MHGVKYTTKHYDYNYVQLCLQKPVKAYRLLTEWLHDIAILDPATYTETETIRTMSNLYDFALKELSSLFIYHGLLYKNHRIFTGYFYLYSRSFVHQTLVARQSELLQKIKWQYELDDDTEAVNIIVLQTVRNRLAGKPYIDPEPVLQYVLSKRKNKEWLAWQSRIYLWSKYNEQIITLYKKANPFLTDFDIWFLYLQIPLDVWKKVLMSSRSKQRRKKKTKIQVQQTDKEDVYSILSKTGTKYDPLTVHKLFIQSMQGNNDRDTEQQKELVAAEKSATKKASETSTMNGPIADDDNVFSLP